MHAKAYKTLDWTTDIHASSCTVHIAPTHPYFADHHVKQWHVLPGVVYIELMLTACAMLKPEMNITQVTDMAWLRPVMHQGDKITALSLALEYQQQASGEALVQCQLFHDDALCAMATLQALPIAASSAAQASPVVSLQDRALITEHTEDHFDRATIYAAFDAMHIHYGAEFRRISYVQRRENRALAWLSNNDGVALDWANLLDCAFQTGMAISIGTQQDSLMPYSLGVLTLHPDFRLEQLGSAFVLTVKHTPFRTSLSIYNDRFEPMISVRDLGVKAANF